MFPYRNKKSVYYHNNNECIKIQILKKHLIKNVKHMKSMHMFEKQNK